MHHTRKQPSALPWHPDAGPPDRHPVRHEKTGGDSRFQAAQLCLVVFIQTEMVWEKVVSPANSTQPAAAI